MRDDDLSPKTGRGRDSAPSPVDIHVGQCLRARRVALGVTQENLGRLAGITFQQIQKYEKGTNRISASRLYDFATILGVPPESFFEGLPSPLLEDSPEGDPMGRHETLALVSAFQRIPSARVRAAALALLKSMTARKG